MGKFSLPAKSLWPDYLLRIEVKAAIKTGVTAGLSFFLGVAMSGLINRPDNLVSGLWCILTSIVVLQPHVGGTYRAGWVRFLGIFIGSILGAVFTTWFGSSPLTLGVSIACTVFICSLLNLSDSFRIASMSVAVVMVLWGLHPEINPWVFGMYRFIDSCLGILVAVAVTHTLWPSQATSTVQRNIAKSFQLISQLMLNGTNLEAPQETLEKTAKEDLEELDGLIHENLNTLDETKIELLILRSGLENWKALTKACDMLFDELAVLNGLDKHILSMIIDDELAKHLDVLISTADSMLKTLSKQMEKNQWCNMPMAPALDQALAALQNDLARFRGTKTTRKFDLQDVEGFFVFFHTVVLIAGHISRLEENVRKVLVPKEKD